MSADHIRNEHNQIFLAHSSNDKNFVRSLKRHLRSFGFVTWLDEDEIQAGSSILNAIQSGIGTSRYVCVVLSASSVKSEWMRRELNAGLTIEIQNKSIVVVPALLENCEIPLFLRDKKYADFRESYTTGFEELLKAFEYEPATSIFPGQERTRRWLSLIEAAWEYLKKGEHWLADTQLNQAIRLEPEDAKTWNLLGSSMLLEGLPANALHAFAKAEALEPRSKKYLFDEATCALLYYANGQDDPWGMYPDPELKPDSVLKLALRCLEKCRRIDADDPVVRYQLGVAYALSGCEEKAEREYRAALTLCPDYKKAQHAMLMLQGDIEAAKELEKEL